VHVLARERLRDDASLRGEPPVGPLPQPLDEVLRLAHGFSIADAGPKWSCSSFRIVLYFVSALDGPSACPPHEKSAGDAPRVRREEVATINQQGGGSMATLKGSKTHENLKSAFAGESMANRRYLYFAKVADVEGYPEVAGNFRDTAEGETGHAHGHLDYLKQVGDPATDLPIGSTERNLAAAVAGETHEYTDMYPGMAKTARQEGFAEIADWFETLAKAEKAHAGRFQQLLKSIS
jgi:rubrerythrin